MQGLIKIQCFIKRLVRISNKKKTIAGFRQLNVIFIFINRNNTFHSWIRIWITRHKSFLISKIRIFLSLDANLKLGRVLPKCSIFLNCLQKRQLSRRKPYHPVTKLIKYIMASFCSYCWNNHLTIKLQSLF